MLPGTGGGGGGGGLLSGSHSLDLEGDSLTVAAAAEGDHVFSDVKGDLFANTGRSVLENVLDQIVAVDI